MARSDVAEAVREAIAAEDAAQLDLLLPGLAAAASLTDEKRGEIVEAVRRRRGRPPGARNLVTRDAVDFIRKTIGDPLIESSRWLLLEPAEMAAILNCSSAEAFDRQQHIRELLARYMHAPKAAVDDAGNAVVPGLTVQIGAQSAHLAIAAPGAPPWLAPGLTDAKTIENQPLSKPADRASHGDASHGGE